MHCRFCTSFNQSLQNRARGKNGCQKSTAMHTKKSINQQARPKSISLAVPQPAGNWRGGFFRLDFRTMAGFLRPIPARRCRRIARADPDPVWPIQWSTFRRAGQLLQLDRQAFFCLPVFLGRRRLWWRRGLHRFSQSERNRSPDNWWCFCDNRLVGISDNSSPDKFGLSGPGDVVFLGRRWLGCLQRRWRHHFLIGGQHGSANFGRFFGRRNVAENLALRPGTLHDLVETGRFWTPRPQTVRNEAAQCAAHRRHAEGGGGASVARWAVVMKGGRRWRAGHGGWIKTGCGCGGCRQNRVWKWSIFLKIIWFSTLSVGFFWNDQSDVFWFFYLAVIPLGKVLKVIWF